MNDIVGRSMDQLDSVPLYCKEVRRVTVSLVLVNPNHKYSWVMKLPIVCYEWFNVAKPPPSCQNTCINATLAHRLVICGRSIPYCVSKTVDAWHFW